MPELKRPGTLRVPRISCRCLRDRPDKRFLPAAIGAILEVTLLTSPEHAPPSLRPPKYPSALCAAADGSGRAEARCATAATERRPAREGGAAFRVIFIFTAAITALCMVAVPALAENDKKTDDDKPADPDTGESTIQEKTLGLLPKSTAEIRDQVCRDLYGEALANGSGGIKRGAVYQGRLTPGG